MFANPEELIHTHKPGRVSFHMRWCNRSIHSAFPTECKYEKTHLAEDYDDDTVAFGGDPNEKDQSDTVSSSSPSIGIRPGLSRA